MLNGRLRKWVKEGGPVTQNVPKAEKKRSVARPNLDLVVPLDWMKRNIRSPDLLMLAFNLLGYDKVRLYTSSWVGGPVTPRSPSKSRD